MAVVGGVSHWVPDEDPDAPPLRDLTVAGLLDEAVAAWPEREAVVFSCYEDLGFDVRWTYAELRERAREVGRALIASGFARGERIGIWATNRPEWLLVQFGAAYAGLVVVPMNPLYRTGEAEYVLGKAGASACFVEPENRGASLWDMLAEASADVETMRLRVGFGGGELTFDEWLEAAGQVTDAQLDARTAEVRPDDTSQIQFTSGTTGFPKGAELRNVGITNNARLFVHRARLRDGGRHCNPMPYFHCGGSVMSTLGSIATGSAQLPTVTFDAARMVRIIETEQATSASAVPTMMLAMEDAVDAGHGSLASLDVVITGGSLVPPDLLRRWEQRFGLRFQNTYGLTEVSPIICQTDPDDDFETICTTVGVPLPYVEVDVVDPATDERVPVGEQGELRTRSIMVMRGYWEDAEATGRAIDGEGFFRSGDLARMTADGHVAITGRAKEMIIRGGENIYPAEIEEAIRRLEGVADVSVVGVPDERYGEQVAVFLRLAEGASMTLDDLRGQLEGRIARYKLPRYLTVLDEFPLTPSGKIQKFRLREQWVAAREGAAAAG